MKHSERTREIMRQKAISREAEKRLDKLQRGVPEPSLPELTTLELVNQSPEGNLPAQPKTTPEPISELVAPAKPISAPIAPNLTSPGTVITSADIEFYCTVDDATLDDVVRCLCSRLGKAVTRGDVLKYIGDTEGCDSWAQYCKKIRAAERVKREAAINSKARGGDLKAVQFIADQQASGVQAVSSDERSTVEYVKRLANMTPAQIRARIAERQAALTHKPGTFGQTGLPMPSTVRLVKFEDIPPADQAELQKRYPGQELSTPVPVAPVPCDPPDGAISDDPEALTKWDDLTPEIQAWIIGFQPDAATTKPSICVELVKLYILVIDSETSNDEGNEPTPDKPLTKE